MAHPIGQSRRRPVAVAVVVVAAVSLLLAACGYRGDLETPLAQKFQWYSFLNGDDIRERCVEGTPPHYRLVYNGRYEEQLRRYEIIGDGAGGAIYQAGAQESANVIRLSTDDVLAPWRWQTSETRLSPPELNGFETALRQSGFFEPAPVGLLLDSYGFYWTVVGCRDGVIHFNAWQFPSARYDRLSFPAWLARFDETEVAVNPPRDVGPAERMHLLNPAKRRGDPTIGFTLTVGEDGLRDHGTLF
jgi:hypothetical protein